MPRSSGVGRLRAAGVLTLTVCLLAAVLPSNPASAEPLAHRPPVPGAIVSPFDLPDRPWQAGNRGIDYDPPPGTPVVASAEGEVVWAGPVAGSLHVTVLHPDGLRTSYSFLAGVTVARGARVRAGDVLGRAGGPVHFGVRAPDGTYLDPEALLAGLLQGRPVLVPGRGEGADPLVERRHLLSVVSGIGTAARWAADTVGAAAGRVRDTAEAVRDSVEAGAALMADAIEAGVGMAVDARRFLVDFVEMSIDEVEALVREVLGDCTPAGHPIVLPTERRIAIVVSGLGTSSDSNSAWEIPVDDLGYEATDVVRFSYGGGRAPDVGNPYRPGDPGIAGIEAQPFDGVQSQQDLRASSARLSDLLQEVAARAPGVPIDVIAHSQGGVVSRLAIDRAGVTGALPDEVENLVTLGSPHGGAHLADMVGAAGESPLGRAALDRIEELELAGPLSDDHPAIEQLATASPVITGVHDKALPEGVAFTSIGARWDVIVPAERTRDDAARHHVIVDTPRQGSTGRLAHAMDAHGAITTAPDAMREVTLALAGRPPTCQGAFDRLGDLGGAATTGGFERAVASVLANSAELVEQHGPTEEGAPLAVAATEAYATGR